MIRNVSATCLVLLGLSACVNPFGEGSFDAAFATLNTAYLVLTNPSDVELGSIPVGQETKRTLIISNQGGRSAEYLAGELDSGPIQFSGGKYPGVGGDCGATLEVGASCRIEFSVTPSFPATLQTAFTLRYWDGERARAIEGIFTAQATCPTNYLAVGANTDVLVSEAFCVAKYEMKILGDNNGNQAYSAAFVADARASGTPWVNIDRNQSITECQALGAGYDLISNAQWQAVAREIELAQTAGVYLNWSNGSTAGANALNRGHSDGTPYNALAASLDSDPCFGTGQASCANNTSVDFRQKRTHTLSNGEVIWDVAGNVYEWVKLDIAAGPPYEGGNNFVSQQPWTAGLNHPEMWGPFGNYTLNNSGEYGGLGYGFLSFFVGAVLRGGDWDDGTNSGVFSATLGSGPLGSAFTRGFRCVSAAP